MTVVENNASSINPFAENLPSPGLGEPYAASPPRSLSNHGSPTWSRLPEICKLPNIAGTLLGTYPVTEMGTAANAAALTKSKISEGSTSVVGHPQRDDDYSVNTEYNEPESRGRVKKKPHKLVSLKRPTLVHFQRQLLVRCVRRCQKLVVKLLNEEETIQLTGKQLYRTFASSEKKHTAYILLTLEPESREGTQILNSVNKKRGTLIRFKKPLLDFLKGKFLHGLDRQLVEHVKRRFVKLVVKVLNWEETKLLYLEVATVLENNHTDGISPALEAECSGVMMQQDSPCEGQIPESSATNEETNVVGLESIDAIGNSSKNNDTICRWQNDYGITRQVLELLFGKSRDDAAKTLKVSPSTLKRACRDLGITRWPNHKVKRPNSSLNQQEAVKKHKGTQPCPALPPAEATSTLQGNSAMSVKVTYKDDNFRLPLSSSSTMTYLEEQLEGRLKVSLDNFSIKYQDEEDEWISLTCDLDLMHCMDVLRSSGKTVIRMKVSPKVD